MADRVDKGWQTKGLDAYSTEAILGTLAHYGVKVDEAAFKEQSKETYPAQLATSWLDTWKGTGQFKGFPFAAAEALFKRVWPDRLLPSSFADSVHELVETLLEKEDDAGVNTAGPFEKVEAALSKLPEPGPGRAGFMDEVVLLLGESAVKTFDELGESLANAGHVDDARRFAAIEERMLPERVGIATAIVRAVTGERDQALNEIGAIVDDASTAQERRVMAVDAMIHLDDLERAKKAAEPMLAKAEAEQDFHMGLALCERLAHVYEKLSNWNELKALADRAQALAAAHDKAHPHHGHHHQAHR